MGMYQGIHLGSRQVGLKWQTQGPAALEKESDGIRTRKNHPIELVQMGNGEVHWGGILRVRKTNHGERKNLGSQSHQTSHKIFGLLRSTGDDDPASLESARVTVIFMELLRFVHEFWP